MYVRYFRYSTAQSFRVARYVRDGWSGRQQHQQQTTAAVARIQPRVRPGFWPSTPGCGPLSARLERLSLESAPNSILAGEGNHEAFSRTAKMYGTEVLRFGLLWTSLAVIGPAEGSPPRPAVRRPAQKYLQSMPETRCTPACHPTRRKGGRFPGQVSPGSCAWRTPALTQYQDPWAL